MTSAIGDYVAVGQSSIRCNFIIPRPGELVLTSDASVEDAARLHALLVGVVVDNIASQLLRAIAKLAAAGPPSPVDLLQVILVHDLVATYGHRTSLCSLWQLPHVVRLGRFSEDARIVLDRLGNLSTRLRWCGIYVGHFYGSPARMHVPGSGSAEGKSVLIEEYQAALSWLREVASPAIVARASAQRKLTSLLLQLEALIRHST